MARYKGHVSRIYFRCDAGFANPEIYAPIYHLSAAIMAIAPDGDPGRRPMRADALLNGRPGEEFNAGVPAASQLAGKRPLT